MKYYQAARDMEEKEGGEQTPLIAQLPSAEEIDATAKKISPYVQYGIFLLLFVIIGLLLSNQYTPPPSTLRSGPTPTCPHINQGYCYPDRYGSGGCYTLFNAPGIPSGPLQSCVLGKICDFDEETWSARMYTSVCPPPMSGAEGTCYRCDDEICYSDGSLEKSKDAKKYCYRIVDEDEKKK
ncbi:hypothetical protein EON65_13360 [archaeon]|nr:MAG: hypothetical protein EON65_13360 [archaeon]